MGKMQIDVHGEMPSNGYTITRLLDAPRDLVFSVWTEPEHIRNWMFPANFQHTDGGGEVRVGGEWFAVIRSPGGEDYRMEGEYVEVVPGRRIVQTHQWINADSPGVKTLITITFEDEGSKTRLTFTQTGFEARDMRLSNSEGWGEVLDNLDAYLRREAA
ncbi:SRPBCC family protein [Pyruvatibacter mobilis]|uniref:SRPBCC family protein n=1 Tax=Pyruvatibacter mobilis TaxID=1712261 RepID=UPI003C7AD25D